MSNTKLSAEQIMARGELEGLTAYQIASLINFKLVEAGVDKIRPQMMYNYSRNGMIAAGVKGDMSARYTVAQATAYIDQFVAKRIAKAAVKVEQTEEVEGQLELEFQA